MTERELRQGIVTLLRTCGWCVMPTSQPGMTKGGQSGLPDILAFRHDTTLLIECKTPTGTLRPSQAAFRDTIISHVGPHLHYIVASSVDDVMEFCNGE